MRASQSRIVRDAIAKYAAAYAELQKLQDEDGLIPPGDQKTGSIGEFYVRLYLEGEYPSAKLSFAGHSTKGWDILVSQAGTERRIQTKTVSDYSKTRKLSPISAGWDQLFVVCLDRSFQPTGFYVVTDSRIVSESGLKGCSAPCPRTRRLGSAKIPFGENRIDEFMRHVRSHLNAAPTGTPEESH